MNKKGFTLIELLAVIVILAIIALIAVPSILNIIEDSKKSAAEASARGIAREAENYYAQSILNGSTPTSIDLSTDILNYNGEKPEKGLVSYDKAGRTHTKLYMDGYCVIVDYDNKVSSEKVSSDGCNLNSVLLSLAANGGTVEYASKEYNSGDEVGELPVPIRAGYTFKDWVFLDDTIVTRDYKITANTTIIAKWEAKTFEITFNRNIFDNGEVVYFNPNTGLSCNKEDAVSTTGTKDGCMKWYAFLDNSGSKIKLILDHNTTPIVAWNIDGGQTPVTALAQLQNDITNWNDDIKSTARLISSSEINQIAPNSNWNINDRESYYVLHDNAKTDYYGPIGSSKYAWLFDNMDSCETYGCNIEQAGVYSYWTSNAVGTDTNVSWGISRAGALYTYGKTNITLTGIRPVIEVSKDVFKETKTVTYDDTYGELPELEKHGYIFLGWYTDSDEKITKDSTVSITADTVLKQKWQKAEIVYPDGYELYFNPNTNAKCNKEDAVSTTGTKDGCMKWYAFLDNNTSKNVKLLLDHNTTHQISWNTDNTKTTPDTVNAKLQADITNWNNIVKNTTRLITATEVNQIAPSATNHIWKKDDSTTYYHFHTGTFEKYEGAAGTNKYAWLFDNSIFCDDYGCNVEQTDNFGYWTSDYSSGGGAWHVGCNGNLYSLEVDFPNSLGVRPVIEVPKTIFTQN